MDQLSRLSTIGAASRIAVVVCFMMLTLLFVLSSSSLLVNAEAASSDTPHVVRRDSTWIQQVVDDYRARLAVPNGVRVSIVPRNALIVSVEAVDDRPAAFVLSLEEDFIDGLTEDELRAAIAHELGHVWIFTHHPYLQTEKLANEIAMRLVTREMLTTVYEKVWERQGAKGDLARFVGD